MYCNFCCSYSFGPEIIKIGQSSHKMNSNNIVNFQESTSILNACTKKSGNLLCTPRNIKYYTNADMQFNKETLPNRFMAKIVKQARLFSFGEATILGK